MEYKLNPKTFKVKEIFNPQLGESGKYFYYILEKKNLSHKQLKKKLAGAGEIYFCGIKDKNASTKQWFCTTEIIDEIDDEDLKIKFKGCSNERIHIGSHKGNQFEVIVKVNESEQKTLAKFKAKNEFVCNYFGEQRFDKRVKSFSELLLEKKFESALKAFLTEPSEFDSEKSTAIKKTTKENWGNWTEILKDELIGLTKKRELFAFLANNGNDFEKAFDFVEKKALKYALKASQAMRFNKKLDELARKKKPDNFYSEIGGEEVAMCASKAFAREIKIEATEFEKKYAPKRLVRKTFFTAGKFGAKKVNEKEYKLSFELGKGEYATVFLKFLKRWLDKKSEN